MAKEKPKEVRKREYILEGFVASLIRFFGVPKGPMGIQMVYDGSVSGLNDALWAPFFVLPTVSSQLSGISPDSYMRNNDLGEMFLNFQLDPLIQPYCGVDLTTTFPDVAKESSVVWE